MSDYEQNFLINLINIKKPTDHLLEPVLYSEVNGLLIFGDLAPSLYSLYWLVLYCMTVEGITWSF